MNNDIKIIKLSSQVRYRGMHNIISIIAKDQRCSMNKARKIYTLMHKSGYIMFYLTSVIPSRNKRVYSEKVLKDIRSDGNFK